MTTEGTNLARYIRDIPDWPKPGILFRDITPLLADPKAFPAAVDALGGPFRGAGIEYVAAVEARGPPSSAPALSPFARRASSPAPPRAPATSWNTASI